ncbi:MAG: AAA family ATPase [Bacteroidota bacterium]
MPTNLNKQGLTSLPNIPLTEVQLQAEHNQLTEIPASIGSLVYLNNLYLRNNKISVLPKEIGNLKRLRLLLLGNNQIDNLPAEIGKLNLLTQLRIENNKLSELPSEIGLLSNLTHLFLENNQLNYLPEEIKKLTKLVHLSINGNNLKLPEDYAHNNPKRTIEYILEHQDNLSEKNSLITDKAYYFLNASKENIVGNYKKLVADFSIVNSIEFIPIISEEEINRDTNIVFIFCPIDVHTDTSLLNKIAKQCKKMGKRFFIFIQDQFIETDFNSANLDNWNTFQKTKTLVNKNFSNEFKPFSSYEELNNLTFEALKQHKPNIKLEKLTIENIGHFDNLEITFNDEITCLIGENGSGKSTILKSIALAIIGGNHKNIKESVKRSFLKILDFDNDKFTYQNGLIKLDYTIDGKKNSNEIILVPNDNGNDISFSATNESSIIYNNYNLKSLVIGFPQERGIDNISNSNFIQSKNTQPHINDLIPLINGSDEFRLRSFSDWIANLYFDSIKKNERGDSSNSEKVLIETVFSVISDITKKEIKFKTVTKVAPPDVWVFTNDTPNGIPLSLISQGFRMMIGWIGHLMQRFVDTFPLSNPISAFQENAIVIIDEVDISMHPLWQVSFIEILRKIFPKTQFICSTHDPLIIGSLLKEQVRVFIESNGNINTIQPETDPKGLGVAGILTSELFGLSSTLDEKTLKVLDRRNELISKQDKNELSNEEKIELNEIFHVLNRLGINTTDRDPLYQKFIAAISERDEFKKDKYTIEELKAQNDIALETLDELLKEQGIK